jgi:hypothetical protein
VAGCKTFSLPNLWMKKSIYIRPAIFICYGETEVPYSAERQRKR